ncbi:MAG: M23 family metallopeptidase [Jiangellaceae bacterium]|nr:M23 family metallopeptidase [Jiangellaceae bacterium]
MSVGIRLLLPAVIGLWAQALANVAPAAALAPDGWRSPLGPESLHVLRAFDPPAQPWLPGHRGVDLAATVGLPVYAAGDGVVAYAGLVAGRGVVVVRHGLFRTTYEPVTGSVAVGQHVVAGDQIGVVSSAPTHCAPATCLHWGLRKAATYLDPMGLLQTGRPRLLPLGEDVFRPLLPARSGAWVRLRVDPSKAVDGDMRVDLRGGKRRVAEQLLHAA